MHAKAPPVERGTLPSKVRPAMRSLLIVGLGTLVVPLDSAVNIGFPAIVGRFNLPIPMIQWIVIAYVLTQTSLMLTFGRIGDILGHRRVFLSGTLVSTAAFVGCALATTYPMLLIARVAQGVGAGLILSCGPALATSLFPEAMRTAILVRYMMMFGIGSALGPSVFGWLVAHFGWSAVFSFRAPIAATAFVLAWTLPRPRNNAHQPFDAVGGILLALGLGAMLLALNRLRSPDLMAAAFATVSVAALVLFYRNEHRVAKPIIDFSYFRDTRFTMINISNVLINLSAFAIMLLVPFYLSRIPGLPLPAAGLILAASPAGTIMAAPVAGWLMSGSQISNDLADRALADNALANRGRRWRLTPRATANAGMILNAFGLFGVSLSDALPEIPIVVLFMVIQGIGLGLFQVAYLDIITAKVPARDRGVAGSLAMATRTIGTVTGATVLMLIFQSPWASAHGGFAGAFQTTFRLAAALPTALTLLEASSIAIIRLRPAGK